MRRLLAFLLVTISAFVGLASASPPTLIRFPECPWKLDAVRAPKSEEVSFEEATHYLRPGEWEERNKVFGPGSLVAYVRADARHRAYLEIEDWKAGNDSVFVYPDAGLPAWSPDGRYLSVNVWTPATRTGKLVILDVSKWRIVVDIDLTSASNSKWSPDSRCIAVAGASYAGDDIVLYSVNVPDGNVSVIDTTRVFGDIEFSWSPDSRWIAYAKPTKVHHVGDTLISDLWIAEAATSAAWCLLKGTDHNQSNPLWITDRTLQVDRVWWDEDEDANWTNREQRVVVELSPSR